MTASTSVVPPPQSNSSTRWKPDSKIGRKQERLAWLLVLPSLFVVLLVAIYPLIETFRLSFTNKRLASTRVTRYVGLDNYRTLLDDKIFTDAIWNTVVFTVTSVAFETALGMIIALTIHSHFRGRGVVRASMLIPWAIPTVVSATMWAWMYHDVFSVSNDLLYYQFGVIDEKIAWLANPDISLWAIIAVDIWKTTPFMALLLLAGLQVIPGDIYEAALVDGASSWQQFWQITVPLLKPALLVALIFRTLYAFRVFDVIYVMKGYATDTMSIAVYTQRETLEKAKIGYGSAAAVIIFICIAIFVVIYTRIVRVEEM